MSGTLRQGKRSWIKLHTLECLEGSIRYQLEPDERGVWYDLLVFSAICRNDGVISDRDGKAFPHSFIANRLNISLKLLEATLKKCFEEGRLTEDEQGIHVTNWKVYQSEYERVKKYRDNKSEHLGTSSGDKPRNEQGRDPRRAPYETQEMFEERLKLFGASVDPPGDTDEFQKESDKLVKRALSGGKQFIDRGNDR